MLYKEKLFAYLEFSHIDLGILFRHQGDERGDLCVLDDGKVASMDEEFGMVVLEKGLE